MEQYGQTLNSTNTQLHSTNTQLHLTTCGIVIDSLLAWSSLNQNILFVATIKT